MALLDVKSLEKHFGGVHAVDGVDLHVEQGEILSVIGPNGAGKTTLFNVVTGFYPPDEGGIAFEGLSISGLKPNQICTVGIARTFQAGRLFPNMTVLENVMVGQHVRTHSGLFGSIARSPRTRREESEIEEKARTILGAFGDRFPRRIHHEYAASLAYADRRRLEIARAMATEPKLLLLDEPTAGMNPRETGGLTTFIGELRSKFGYTIVLIEHDMRVVRGVSDRVIALDYGKKIAEGTYEDVSSNEKVIEAYLGKRHHERERSA
jgi:ABC-type branched-subunit amino acid transport system ATPase component